MAVVLRTLAQRTVTAAGTEVQLTAATVNNVVKAWVTCPAANTGSIYIGDASVSTTRGIEVPRATTLVLDCFGTELLDLNNMWVDAATSGDDFQVTYLERV